MRNLCILALVFNAVLLASSLKLHEHNENKPWFAPLTGSLERSVPGRYLVRFRTGAANVVKRLLAKLKIGDSFFVQESCMDAFVATIPERLVSAIRKHPKILHVERDQEIDTFACEKCQQDAGWYLARLSKNTTNGANPQPYAYGGNEGEDVDIYVLDTGVNVNHNQFNGRASWGAVFTPDGSQTDDVNHGTCVASLAAGETVGTARKAKIISVKVIRSNGVGRASELVQGICWVINQVKSTNRKSVINMSLGVGIRTPSINNAVEQAFSSGIPVIVAAGNARDDACDYSPASAEKSFTVGATDASDRLAYFSNWGRCVKILAPGDQLVCASNKGGDEMLRNAKGTSLACPLVAGLAASLVSDRSSINPQSVYDTLLSWSQRGVVSNIGGATGETPNILAGNECRKQPQNACRARK